MAFPRVHGIDIMNFVIASQLQMAWDFYLVKAAAVKPFPVKCLWALLGIAGIAYAPNAV
jgi:hypothetical protein